MKNKKQSAAPGGAFRNNLYLYREAWALDKKRVLGEWIISLTGYFIWVFFSIVFIKYLLFCMENDRPLREPVVFVIATMSAIGLISLYRTWFFKYYRPLSQNRMFTAFSKRLFKRAREADLANYEDADFYNSYTLAVKEAGERLESVLTNIPTVGAAFVSAAGVAGTMGSIDPFVLLFVLFPVIGNFVLGKRLNGITFNRDRQIESHRRKISYADRVYYMGEYAKELRLSKIRRVLEAVFEHGLHDIMTTFDRYRFNATATNFVQNMLTFVFNFEGVFLYGTYLAMVKKSIALSDFAVLASGVVSVSWMIIRLSAAVVELMKNGTYISNLRTFLETEPTITGGSPDAELPGTFETLEFKSVSFAYTGQDGWAVEGMNLKLRRGEKIALVGVNGAGKSSVVKLLTRLYDPTEGSILYNGRDIKTVPVNKYRDLFATAFQDFRIFSLSVTDNVTMGSAGVARDAVDGALTDAGVMDRVRELPKGRETVLTRELDDGGAVLSGGEYQKIAIARAFARDCEIYLLDEPSSALDPIAEYALYENMMKRCRDKTVMFISHRLSSATLADRIIVMDGGRIVEEGDHAQLMSRGGIYAGMFRMQAERYVIDNYQTFEEAAQ